MTREQMIAWLTLEGWTPYYYCNGVRYDDEFHCLRHAVLGYWRDPEYVYVRPNAPDTVYVMDEADAAWRAELSRPSAYFTDEFSLLPGALETIFNWINGHDT